MAGAPPGRAWQEGGDLSFADAERLRAIVWLAMGLLLTVPQPGLGEEPQVFRGEWLATAEAGRSLKGRWIGQALPGQPSAMHGSWTLSASGGRTVLRGTWSARKEGRGWSGTWSAEDQNGKKLSGTWLADHEDSQGPNLEDLFRRTLTGRASGSWQARGRRGHWWLKGSLPGVAP
jgi:hypothetical protein